MRHLACAFMIAASLLARPALGQQPGREAEAEEIVVTGNRDVERQARDFVDALTPRPIGGQLARFEWEVCPAAVGLGPAQKAAVERRLRSIAAAAAVPLAKSGCAPNAILILADDKRALLQALLKQRPDYFGNLSLPATRSLLRSPGPTAAWQLQREVSARGVPIEAVSPGEVPINRTTDSPSRITAAARPVFEASALIVERGALDGLTTTQLADYAAMRLFARTDPDRLVDPAAPTIVKILDAPMGAEVPLSLTAWDLGYLRGLYASQVNLYSGAQRSSMSRQILKDLKPPPEADSASPEAPAKPRPNP